MQFVCIMFFDHFRSRWRMFYLVFCKDGTPVLSAARLVEPRKQRGSSSYLFCTDRYICLEVSCPSVKRVSAQSMPSYAGASQTLKPEVCVSLTLQRTTWKPQRILCEGLQKSHIFPNCTEALQSPNACIPGADAWLQEILLNRKGSSFLV